MTPIRQVPPTGAAEPAAAALRRPEPPRFAVPNGGR